MSGQAAWVKEGTYVRWKGGGQYGTRGIIVTVPGGLAVRYAGEALVWSGNIAESWVPCVEGDHPLSASSVMLDESQCAKPAAPPERLDHTGRVRSEACYVCKAAPMAPCTDVSGSLASVGRADHPRPPSTMERVLARLDMLETALKPLARMSFDAEGRVVMAPDGIQIDGVVHEERAIYARAHGLTRALDALCDVCKSPEGHKCWLTFEVTLERERLVKEASVPAVGPSYVADTHADPPTTKRYVQAHQARYEAAAASGWTDSYMASCSRCGAARWEGCTAVGDEPDFGEPMPRVNVRLWNAEGTPHFMSIPWPDRGEAVARGLFEVCAALVPPMPGVLRPGLRPVARTWESLDDEERDYWHGLVKDYLDGTREERTAGAVEWAALGAMVRVFGIGRVR